MVLLLEISCKICTWEKGEVYCSDQEVFDGILVEIYMKDIEKKLM
jgi:hypothetical protein